MKGLKYIEKVAPFMILSLALVFSFRSICTYAGNDTIKLTVKSENLL